MTIEQITTITLYLHVTGGLLAIFLYAGLGKIFWVPMAIDYAYWHAIGLIVDMESPSFSTFLVFSVFVMLQHIWIIYLSGIMRYRWGMAYLFLTVMLASFVGIWSESLIKSLGENKIAHLLGFSLWIGNPGGKWLYAQYIIYYSWSFFSLILALSVLIHHTFLRRLKGIPTDFLMDPKRRVLIPLLVLTTVTCFIPIAHFCLPAQYSYSLANIVGSMMGWMWIALELPFYIMYRRMLKHYPNLSRRDFSA